MSKSSAAPDRRVLMKPRTNGGQRSRIFGKRMLRNGTGLFCLAWLLMVPNILRADSRPQEELPLTLRECLLMALDQNLEISIERLGPKLDEAAILQNRGDFDPSLVLTPRYEENNPGPAAQLPASAGGLGAVKSRTSSWSSSLAGKIPMGTEYDFGLQTTDSENALRNFRDQFSTFWGLSLSQPLLKGFGPASQLSVIRIARKQKEISVDAFALKVMEIVTRIQNAYHNLAFAVENRRVRIQSLDLAAKLLEDNRKRVQIGVMAPLEATQAESGMATREDEVIRANEEVNVRMNELRSLISRDVAGLQQRFLNPVDRPTDAPPPVRARADVMVAALQNRPDYHQAKIAVEQKHLQVKFDENQGYPQVDLNGSYGFNGVDANFGKSVGTENEKWALGMAVRIPLPDQAGQGRLQKSRLEKERTLLELKRVEQTILVEVDNALTGVENSHKRIGAARVATRAAGQSLTAEMGKLKRGLSTSFVVLELQKQLAEAKSRELRAVADHAIAIAQLQQAEGATLRANQIELVDEGAAHD